MSDVRYRRAADAVWRATPHMLVAALPPAAPTVVGGSAAAVWRLLEHAATAAELAASLAADTGQPADVLMVQLQQLLHDLETAHLVERVS